MLFENINFLLEERGAMPLSSSKFLKLDPNDVYDLVSQLNYSFEVLNTVDLRKKKDLLLAKSIKLLVLDVDGVFTDGGLFYTSAGEEAKKFNVKDGMAITQAIKRGVQFGIISAASRSEVVETRAAVLGIQHVYVGKTPKIEILEKWLYQLGIGFDEVAYIGDDVNDVAILKRVGIGACPADAASEAKEAADYILRKGGGAGCIREFVELFLND